MKVNMDAVLCNLDGKPLDSDGKPATLKVVSIEALMAMTDEDRSVSGEEKFSRYELATKLNAGGEIELSPEDAAKIKKRIGLCYGAAVVGPAFKLLNG